MAYLIPLIIVADGPQFMYSRSQRNAQESSAGYVEHLTKAWRASHFFVDCNLIVSLGMSDGRHL